MLGPWLLPLRSRGRFNGLEALAKREAARYKSVRLELALADGRLPKENFTSRFTWIVDNGRLTSEWEFIAVIEPPGKNRNPQGGRSR